MSLSYDLISQFVKITKDETPPTKETVTYGTVMSVSEGSDAGKQTAMIRLDGADPESEGMPATCATDVATGDRVIVMIKNHNATVTGNVNDRSAKHSTAQNAVDTVNSYNVLIANKVSTEDFTAEQVRVNNLIDAEKARITTLTTRVANVEELKADKADVNALSARFGVIEELSATHATIEALNVEKGRIDSLDATHGEFERLTASKFESTEASISELDTKKLSAEEATITYANIDFSNIGNAAIEYFFAQSGLIENVIVGDGTVTGTLVGVTIKGDLIDGNTIVADKLVIQGEDGLYYKLNTNGITTSAEQTEYNSLNGSVIMAKSITATQVSVDDLVAFDATIGGFAITEDSIYSDVKDSDGNTTRGIHLSVDGQMNVGDESNFIKYYRDENGDYKLAISAASILYALNGKQYSIADLGPLGEYVHISTYVTEGSKNYFDISVLAEEGAWTSWMTECGLSVDVSSGTISIPVQGETGAQPMINFRAIMPDVEVGKTYTISYNSDTNACLRWGYMDEDIGEYVLIDWNSGNNYTFVATEQFLSQSPYFSTRDIRGTGFTVYDILVTEGTVESRVEAKVEPCIELGESDSDFKLVITNTRIMFMEGSSVPAHITNQSLHITKAVIEEEIQQGDYVWKVRANGNLGLMWKGATS